MIQIVGPYGWLVLPQPSTDWLLTAPKEKVWVPYTTSALQEGYFSLLCLRNDVSNKFSRLLYRMLIFSRQYLDVERWPLCYSVNASRRLSAVTLGNMYCG